MERGRLDHYASMAANGEHGGAGRRPSRGAPLRGVFPHHIHPCGAIHLAASAAPLLVTALEKILRGSPLALEDT